MEPCCDYLLKDITTGSGSKSNPESELIKMQSAINELMDYIAENDKIFISRETVLLAKSALENRLLQLQGIEHKSHV